MIGNTFKSNILPTKLENKKKSMISVSVIKDDIAIKISTFNYFHF